MRRAVVLGGTGTFGRTVREGLGRLGVETVSAARGAEADIRVDAGDRASILKALRRGDVVVDAAGPFQARSTTLIECACQLGFDLVDLNDDLSFALKVMALERSIRAAGIRVLSSCSSVSVMTALAVRESGIGEPVRVNSFLAPASRFTATAGTARSLIHSAGEAVRVWRGGALREVRGWSEPRSFPLPPPLGEKRFRLFESADAVWLPRAWPGLEEVAMYAVANAPGLDAILAAAAAFPAMRAILERLVRPGAALVRAIGSPAGGLGYEIAGKSSGAVVRLAMTSARGSHLIAAAPAILAARSLAGERFEESGLVPPERQLDPGDLLEHLASAGIRMTRCG